MDTKLSLAGVIRESIVDGPGFRLVVFVQGCPHNCEGCQNPKTHAFEGGYLSTVGNIIEAVKANPLLAGVTLSGGEPFCQAPALSVLAKEVHRLGLNVITFSGWTFEQIVSGFDKNEGWNALLCETDYLIDGKFILAQKSLSLKFRGSTNQRIIDAKASLQQNKAVESQL